MHDLAEIRIALATILLIGLSISTLHRWRAAQADDSARRRDEPATLKLVRLSLALPGAILILGSLAAPSHLGWATFDIGLAPRVLGVALAACALPLSAWLFPHLGANVTATALVKREHSLVTTGPYRWVRHPLYLAGLLLSSGIGLGLASWPILGLSLVVLVVWLAVIIPREEDALAERFGADYIAYRRRTGALIPKLGPHREK